MSTGSVSLSVPLRTDDIAVIGADVIMSKVVLDICRKFGHCGAAFDKS
jgi:hypothetical protein